MLCKQRGGWEKGENRCQGDESTRAGRWRHADLISSLLRPLQRHVPHQASTEAPHLVKDGCLIQHDVFAAGRCSRLRVEAEAHAEWPCFRGESGVEQSSDHRATKGIIVQAECVEVE